MRKEIAICDNCGAQQEDDERWPRKSVGVLADWFPGHAFLDWCPRCRAGHPPMHAKVVPVLYLDSDRP